MATKDFPANNSYMECVFRIENKAGWERALTKVLASFEEGDLWYEINPLEECVTVIGKTNPHTILMKLKKSNTHATIHRISYGIPRDDPYQYPWSNFYDPFNHHHYSRNPFEAYNNRFYNPNNYHYDLYSLPQQRQQPPPQPLEDETPFDQCPVHLRRGDDPDRLSSSHSRLSDPSVPEEANYQGNFQFVPKGPSGVSIKKITKKLLPSCFG